MCSMSNYSNLVNAMRWCVAAHTDMYCLYCSVMCCMLAGVHSAVHDEASVLVSGTSLLCVLTESLLLSITA
jgi:hypothetical protein